MRRQYSLTSHAVLMLVGGEDDCVIPSFLLLKHASLLKITAPSLISGSQNHCHFYKSHHKGIF